MANTLMDTVRACYDLGLGIESNTIGMNPYPVYLTTITNQKIAFADDGFGSGGTFGTPTRTDTRILVYQGGNPQVADINGEIITPAQAALTNKEIYLGPIVMPYITSTQTGGTDPIVFQQAITFGNNGNQSVQYWIWVQGIDLNRTNGNYYDVKEMCAGPMHGFNYYVKMVGTSNVPSIAPNPSLIITQ